MSTVSSSLRAGSGGAALDSRPWTAFLLWLGAWSLLIGFADTARSALALERFGGTEYLSRVAVLGATREYAAAVCSGSASAALFGGVDWLGFWLPIGRVLAWSDIGVGLLNAALQTLIVLAFAWAGLAWLAARERSLFWKIAFAWFVTAAGYVPVNLLQNAVRSGV